MVAAFDFCLHGNGGAAPSIDTAMHGLVERAARGSPAPGLGDRAGHRGGRGEADRRVLRRPGGVGAVAAARFPARPGHRGDRRGQPAGHRRGAGRARHHRVGADQRGVRGAVAGDHPDGRGLHRGAGPPGAVRPGHRGLRGAARRASGGPGRPRWLRSSAGWPRPTGRRSATTPTPTWCSTSCPGPSTRGWPRSARPARTTSCGPRSARWCSTCRQRPRWRGGGPAAGAARGLPRRLRRLLPAARRARLAADAGRGPGDRAGARHRHVQLRCRQADRPGGRASSTSTRST